MRMDHMVADRLVDIRCVDATAGGDVWLCHGLSQRLICRHACCMLRSLRKHLIHRMVYFVDHDCWPNAGRPIVLGCAVVYCISLKVSARSAMYQAAFQVHTDRYLQYITKYPKVRPHVDSRLRLGHIHTVLGVGREGSDSPGCLS